MNEPKQGAHVHAYASDALKVHPDLPGHLSSQVILDKVILT